MTMNEYEERFRTPAPSLHQIFAATRGPHTTRRRSRRFWVAASVLVSYELTRDNKCEESDGRSGGGMQ